MSLTTALALMSIREEQLGVEDGTAIAAAGFIQDYNPGLENDVRVHLNSGKIFTIYEDENKIGFVIYEVFDDILYISGIVMLPSAQGQGYAQKIVRQLCNDTGLPFLGYRTQSPRMWSIGYKLCDRWYPNPEGTQPNAEMLAKIHFLRERIGMPTYPVSKGFYGHALYGCKPTLKDPAIQLWWDDMCCFEDGDSVICFGAV